MYRVHLEQFEGPLDLLLFFIRRDELDIYDIPVARITDEYLEYVTLLEQVDLDGAAEFIYMAALLISIKARMLLPRPDLDEDGEPIDPRRELVERLLEYIRYKEAANHLDEKWTERHELIPRGQASSEAVRFASSVETTYRVSVYDLMEALKRVLERTPDESGRHELPPYEYTVEEQRQYVFDTLSAGPSTFVGLVNGQSKRFVIVTFLAILEMLQRQVIHLVAGISPEDFGLRRAQNVVLEHLEHIEQPPDKVREIEMTRESDRFVPANGADAGS
ncbi:MAG: segregation/condensation protein A [Rubricoccaceae bacterium]|nr:segregation/condensation protein A [Rubricoccaceae bacterium]